MKVIAGDNDRSRERSMGGQTPSIFLHRLPWANIVLGGALSLLMAAGAPLRAADAAAEKTAAAPQRSEAGQQVIVVYNSKLAASKSVAEHYAALRHVPANQVFGLPLSTNEVISRTEFRDSLQRPLADLIAKQRLWRISPLKIPATTNLPAHTEWKPAEAKIRYAVLCYGVPLRIEKAPELKEEATEKMRPEMRRNEAAVDSELALLPLIEEHLPLAGPLRNIVYGTTNTAALHPTNGILLVARLDGPTPEIARSLVDKAIQAETNGLWGRAYFDLRNTADPGYKIGDNWIRDASEIARRLGFETTVDQNPGTFPPGFPMSQIALYIGWYDEHLSGPFTRPVVEFMPGAFAYHLHSYSAVSVRSPTRGWTGPLLAKGVTATMGCVDEPYLTGTPDLAVFTARFLFNGFSLGEAAYASQPVLSWQTTVVGDPLYRPFAENPDQLQDRLLQQQSPLLEWAFLRLINVNFAAGKPLTQCIEVLESMEPVKTSSVLAEKLADLYAAQGKPSSAAHQYAKALQLKASPQQRLRMLLTLGDKLIALNRDADAMQAFQLLLKENPDYPDKPAIYRRLLPLAQNLKQTNEVEKYQALLRPPDSAAPATK